MVGVHGAPHDMIPEHKVDMTGFDPVENAG
jgi:hypothetical protein